MSQSFSKGVPVDTDVNLAADSDLLIPSQKAVKAYVTTHSGGSLSSITASSPLTGGTITTSGTIGIPQASASQDGYLSSGNWSTFNGKQDAITLTTTGTGAATLVGSTLNIPTPSGGGSYTFSTGLTNTSGTVTNNLSTGVSGGQSVIGGTAASNSLTLSSTSNATKGKLLFGTSAYDEVNNRLSIGTTSTSYPLEVRASGANFCLIAINSLGTTSGSTPMIIESNDTWQTIFEMRNSTTRNWQFGVAGSANSFLGVGCFGIYDSTAATHRLKISTAGNISINSYTDAGYKLDVNGTARVSTSLESPIIRGNTTASATLTLQSTSNATKGKILFGTSAYDEVNNRLGILTTSPTARLDINEPTATTNIVSITGSDGATVIDRYGNFLSQGTNKVSGIVCTGVPSLQIKKTDLNGKDWRFEQYRNTTTGALEINELVALVGVYSAMTLHPSTRNVSIGSSTDAGYKLDVNGTVRSTQFYLSALNTAPATAASTGTLGEIRIDANYIYVCTATNTWKRSQIATW